MNTMAVEVKLQDLQWENETIGFQNSGGIMCSVEERNQKLSEIMEQKMTRKMTVKNKLLKNRRCVKNKRG